MPTHIQLDSAVASDAIVAVHYIPPTVQEVGRGAGAVAAAGYEVWLRESAVATDAATGRAYRMVYESAQASDATTSRVFRQYTVRERAEAHDRAYPLTQQLRVVTDDAEASDAVVAVAQRAWVQDSAQASDTATPGGRSQRLLLSRAYAHDNAFPRNVVRVVDQAQASTAYTAFSTHRVVVTDSAIASSVATKHRGDYRLATSAAQATSSYVATTRAVAHVVDQAFGSSEAYPQTAATLNNDYGASILDTIPLDETSVWTADTQTWGMSRYLGVPVTGFDMVQFGVGPGGVYRLSNDPLLAFVETGDMSLSDEQTRRPQLKRLNYVYTYGTHDRELAVVVTADYNGSRLTTEYEQDWTDAGSSRAVRCSVGRGYASNYIRLRVGGERIFDIASMEVETTTMSRRI